MKYFTELEIMILSEKNPKKVDQIQKNMFGPALKRFQELRKKFKKHAHVDHKDLEVVMTVDPAVKKKPSKKKKATKKKKGKTN